MFKSCVKAGALRSNADSLCSRRSVLSALFVLGAALLTPLFACGQTASQTPALGEKAPDFSLSSPAGSTVTLSAELGKGTTVLVVLRGYPGYQCPYCVKQVHDFVDHASEFAAKKTNVLLVYPGPPAELDAHAKEFLAKQADLPDNIRLVIDPDYKVTNQYGLRWNAPSETAYPATFILDRSGKIIFEQVSHSHGDRTTAQDILRKL